MKKKRKDLIFTVGHLVVVLNIRYFIFYRSLELGILPLFCLTLFKRSILNSKEFEQLCQGHAAGTQRGQDSNRGCLMPNQSPCLLCEAMLPQAKVFCIFLLLGGVNILPTLIN